MAGSRRLPRLMLVTDRKTCPDLYSAIRSALEAGLRLVQLREKDLPSGELLDLAKALRELTAKFNALLIVNDRLDVAMLSEADGVHLGEGALRVKEARRLLPSGAIVTAAAHSLDRAVAAEQAGADAVVLGTIFPSASKPGVEPVGLSLLQEVATRLSIPVYAIGGIDRHRAAQALEVGAYGVAIIRAVLAERDPHGATQELLEAIRTVSGKEDASWEKRGSNL